MNDPALIAVFENGLHPQAKFLYSILHAYAGAGGVAVVAESHVAGIMRIGHDRLRGYRSMLNKSGYCSVVLSGASLVFQMTGDHLTRDSDHQVITDQRADIAPVLTSDHLTRESDHQVITDPTPQTPSDHLAREIARGARESDRQVITGGDNRGGESERDLIIPLPEKNSLTHSLSDAERKMSIAALTDPAVGMSVYTASKLAAQYPFPDIRAFCTQFVEESHLPGRVPGTNAGLIAYRLEASETIPPTVHGDFYQRHRTPAEIAAEVEDRRQTDEQRIRWEAEDAAKAAEAIPSPTTQPQPAPTEPQPQPVDVWVQVLARLAATLPVATFARWVKATSLLGVEDGLYTIGAPDAQAREWLHNRLIQPMQRALSGVVGRSVTVQFVVKPTKGEPTDVRANQ